MNTVPLWAVADIRPSNVDKKSVLGQPAVRLVNYTDVYNNAVIHPTLDLMPATASEDHLVRFGVQTGDVIITKDSETPDDIGIPAIVEEVDADMVCGYHLTLLRPRRERVSPKFLYWFLESGVAKDYWLVRANGVTRCSILTGTVESLPVPLLDLTTQQRIADYLDRETGEIDAMLAKLDGLAVALHDRRNAAIDNALQDLPAVRFFSALALSQTGPFGTQLSAREYVDDGIPLINPTHILGGRIWPESHVSVTPAKSDELSRHMLQVGDIILGRKGDVDKAAIVRDENLPALCGSDAMLLRPRPECSARFMIYFFHSKQCHGFLESMSVGAAVTGLNQRTVSELRIPMPIYTEQVRIADHLDEVTARIDAMLAKVAELKALLNERRAALITDVVTGRKEVA